MQFKLILVSAVLSLCFLSASRATEASEAPDMKVSYSDLDLSRQPGKAVLYRRVVQAAREVCRDSDPSTASNAGFQFQFKRVHDACMHNAIEGAVTNVGRSQFTEFVNLQQGRSLSAGIVVAAK